jgi:hypothetical protein
MFLAKVLPEEKIIKSLHKPVFGFGVFVSKFLVIRIGKKAADEFETGIIKTLISVVCRIPLIFLDGMLHDNEIKKPKNGKNNVTKQKSKGSK